MSEKILLTCIGRNDPFGKEKRDGPILGVARNGKFDRVALLHTPDFRDRAEKTGEELSNVNPDLKKNNRLKLECLELGDPVGHSLVMAVMCRAVQEVLREWGEADYYVCPASGTPAMHVSWLLLVMGGALPAKKVLYVRRPSQIKEGQDLVVEVDCASLLTEFRNLPKCP